MFQQEMCLDRNTNINGMYKKIKEITGQETCFSLGLYKDTGILGYYKDGNNFYDT